ncbi:MAG: Gfo/Idh/MocA family oxidoreductase [Planctomycetales bacterium]|nr:Gfo/Idh/MocA family oxidoreductase [Planctomycetales bacterium]
MRLRIGLIGLSRDWQTRHMPALRMLQDRFEVRGVYSSLGTFAENVAREFSTRRYDGFRQMVNQPDIDAIVMLEGDWYGVAPLLAACDAGKAVYCGSEIDFDPEQAVHLKQIVDQSGVAFMAEFPRRYAPATLRLKELIATRLGPPRILFCHRRLACENSDEPRKGRSLKSRIDREIMELIDWCSFIVGRRARSVHSVSHWSNTQSGTPDYQVLSLDLSEPQAPDGTTIAQLSCGAYIPSSWHEAITFRPPAAAQVCCQNGLAFVDLPSSLIWFDEAGRHQESLEAELSVGQQLLTQFHRAVTSLVRKMGDLEDVYRSLATLQAAKESFYKRQTIDLDLS